MKGHAAFPEFEYVERMGEVIARIVEQHVAEPAADDHAEGAIDEKVVDALAARPLGAAPIAFVGHDPADERPAEHQARDIGERVPADGQRPPLHENGIDRRKGQDKRRHRRAPDATGLEPRQGRHGRFIRLLERRFRLFKTEAARELVRREAVIDRTRRRRDRLQSCRAGRRTRPRGAAPQSCVDRSTAWYQTGAQTPSVARRPAAQDSIAASNGTPQAAQSAEQHAARIGQNVLALDHRRRAAEPLRGAVEQFGLGRQADLLEREIVPLLRIGREHRLGRADEEGVDEAVAPVAAEPGSMWCVMCFWYQTGFPSGDGPDERVRQPSASPSAGRRSPPRASDGGGRSRPDRRRKTARRSPRNPPARRMSASSRSRCCADPTTWRCAPRALALTHSSLRPLRFRAP